MGFPMAPLRVLTRSTSSAAAGFAGSSGPEVRGCSSSSLFRRPDMSSTRWRRLSTTRCCFSRASSRFSRYRSHSARSSSMSLSGADWSSRIPATSSSRPSFALSRLSRRCTMAFIPIFGYLPMRKDTCSQWHSACFPPDPAHPAVPGASDSSPMGVSPMLSRVGSVCRATGAVLALTGLSNASASCSRLGSGAVFALVGGLAISSDSEGCS